MTWVKVCGLTREEDVAVAVEAGADAVGFIVAPRSPRRIGVDRVRSLVEGVVATTVLVTVDLSPDALLEAAAAGGVDGVQPHGRHQAEAVRAALDAGLTVLQPIPVAPGANPHQSLPGATALYDRASPGRHGGTGRTFDWSLLADVPPPFVLAGGLGPDNVREAILAVHPYGVDAASLLEAAPGVKDHGKVAAFVREAKRAWR